MADTMSLPSGRPPLLLSALCAQVDPDLFFPERETKSAVAAAKSMCALCPESEPCLAYAMSESDIVGVWGGTTYEERNRLREGAA